MSQPRLSVCIATYNGEKYIKDQLDSILCQCGKDDEIILSDDNSTDKTLEIVRKYNDSRIKIYKNLKEKGYTSNFENALLKAKGKYIFLSDQDDIWMKTKIEITLKNLENSDLVISDCQVVNENLEILEKSYFVLRGKRKGFIGMLYKTDYLGCCMAFNQKILKKGLPFPKNKKMCPHDLWLGSIGYLFFNVKKIDDKLILYRRHNNNASTGGIKGENILFKIKFRIYLLVEVVKRKFMNKKVE
ncbi:MAG: glycosyltransferase family 2 protein [Fusobacteriaceae bacterium]